MFSQTISFQKRQSGFDNVQIIQYDDRNGDAKSRPARIKGGL
jgi:hypothetical protein